VSTLLKYIPAIH